MTCTGAQLHNLNGEYLHTGKDKKERSECVLKKRLSLQNILTLLQIFLGFRPLAVSGIITTINFYHAPFHKTKATALNKMDDVIVNIMTI